MLTFAWIIGASFASGTGALLLAALVLFFIRSERLSRLVAVLVSFSTGTLLGAAFLGMLPHAAGSMGFAKTSRTVLIGIVAFYVLERLLVWRHCHQTDCDVHASSGPLLIIGDAFHNFVDGIVIAGAFLQSLSLGLATAISVFAHEMPQELGDFVVLLQSGYSRGRALALNVLSSLAAILGAVFGYFLFSVARSTIPYLLAFSAASFVYIALADLVPVQRKRTRFAALILELALVLIGIVIVRAVIRHD
jgi:zinc and cadmium transporter